MRDRPHWSYSALSQYLKCPLQYYFQRILKIPSEEVSSSLVLGGALHAALAEYHTALQKGQSSVDPDLFPTFLHRWEEEECHSTLHYKSGETRSDLLELGRQLLTLYLQQPPPENVIGVEQEFLVPLINSRGEILEKPLLAYVDLLTKEETRIRITEFKTSARAYSEQEIQTSLQPTCYLHAVSEGWGLEAVADYTVLVKTKTPKVQTLTTNRDPSEFTRLGDLFETVDRGVELGIFYPHENPLHCSGCPYRQECRKWTAHHNSGQFETLHEESECSRNWEEKGDVSVNRPERELSVVP